MNSISCLVLGAEGPINPPTQVAGRDLRPIASLPKGPESLRFLLGSRPAGYGKPAMSIAPVTVWVVSCPSASAEHLANFREVGQSTEQTTSRWWVRHQTKHLASRAHSPVQFLKCSVGLR